MSYEAWPSPDSPRGPLPRIDDLPIAEQGYEQEAVREAFDAFYRHAAQLDASLKTLETVEVFRRDAMELRNDLRSLRALGFGGSEPSWSASAWAVERPRREISAAVPRLAGEAALVIAVAVVAGVAHFRAVVIVALMAAAWLIVALSEWLAARARYRVPASVYEPLVVEEALEPAPYVESPPPDPGVGWSAFEPVEPEAELEPEELTMVEQTPAEPAAEAADEPEEPMEPEEPGEPAAVEPQAEAGAAAPPRRRGLLRRRAVEDEAPVEAVAEPPSHVRVLAVPDEDGDPWELGFDGDEPEPEPEAEADSGGVNPLKRRRR
jgi:hypothetical protein